MSWLRLRLSRGSDRRRRSPASRARPRSRPAVCGAPRRGRGCGRWPPSTRSACPCPHRSPPRAPRCECRPLAGRRPRGPASARYAERHRRVSPRWHHTGLKTPPWSLPATRRSRADTSPAVVIACRCKAVSKGPLSGSRYASNPGSDHPARPFWPSFGEPRQSPTRLHHAASPLVGLRQFQGLRGDEGPHPILVLSGSSPPRAGFLA